MADSFPPGPRRRRALRLRLRLLLASARLTDSERDRVKQSLFNDVPGELVPYAYRIAVLTALSALIASFGLLENSAAVVIGAMLVSPLMQPMIGLAAAILDGDGRRQLVSIGLIGLAVGLSVGLSALVAWIVPVFQSVTITPEIQLRTAPGILDLGIACAAGAAGAYVTVRPKAAVALPGAAIAVALMPPLAALGILLERGNDALAGGAFLLFVTNLFGIIVASVVVLLILGLSVHHAMSWYVRAALLVPLAFVLAVSYPLVQHTTAAYGLAKDEALVRSVLVPQLRAQGLGIGNIAVVEQPGEMVASIDIVGPKPATGTNELSRELAQRAHRPVSLILRFTKRSEITSYQTPGPG